ncbi:interleukin-1 receptor accessory protein, partial [Scomber scombrus]
RPPPMHCPVSAPPGRASRPDRHRADRPDLLPMAPFISSLFLFIIATVTFVSTVLALVAVSVATPAVSQSVDEPS